MLEPSLTTRGPIAPARLGAGAAPHAPGVGRHTGTWVRHRRLDGQRVHDHPRPARIVVARLQPNGGSDSWESQTTWLRNAMLMFAGTSVVVHVGCAASSFAASLPSGPEGFRLPA